MGLVSYVITPLRAMRRGILPQSCLAQPGILYICCYFLLCIQEQLKQQRIEAAEQLEQVMIDADLTVGRAKGDLARLKSRMSEELTQEQEGSQKLRQSIESMKDATKASSCLKDFG